MPSKNSSDKLKRPPSPYSASSSPRVSPQKTKMWRSLNGPGTKHQNHVVAETTREMWLKSLRLGTDMRQNPIKAVHGLNGTNENVNLALASSSEYLREQLGFTGGGHKRSGSWGSRPQGSRPGTPRYKPQEEMYEEIIQLKKTISSQKGEYDNLKSKVRRLEEENLRKDKSIDQLLEHALAVESGKSKPGGEKVVLVTMKQKQMKLEKKMQEKEDELQASKERIKTLRSKAKAAKASYLDEVMRLQDALKKENAENFEADEEGMTKSEKLSALRRSVVKLTSENTQLQKDNHCLRRDLEQAIDGNMIDDDSEDKSEIKYSALNRMELVTLIKKLKSGEKIKIDEEQDRFQEEQDRLKKVLRRLKEEKNELRNENSEQLLKIEKLEESIEKTKEENNDLLKQLKLKSTEENRQEILRKRRSDARRQEAAQAIERKHLEIKREKAATSIQRHWKKHRNRMEEEEEESVSFLQSAFRGHLAREDFVKSGSSRPTSASGRRSRPTTPRSVSSLGTLEEVEDLGDDSLDEENLSNLQAAMRGHIAREDFVTRDKIIKASSRPSTAGSSSSRRKYSSQQSHDYTLD
uniref:IQ domain-containing protein E-like isoform X2 n=1 Tax=Ciona intestinalis TaxID=7719 RepID=UPI000180CAE5|nr:IQ domain-containing protein E-like isoform X2 [Ciona intestinalis]|eukprot:XP_002128738.1 IQ domain-containing protein E-like isoform X2 [Ciona intestinalis]